MEAKTKKYTLPKAAQKVKFVISDKVGNYDNDPYFIKKNKKADASVAKFGLPK